MLINLKKSSYSVVLTIFVVITSLGFSGMALSESTVSKEKINIAQKLAELSPRLTGVEVEESEISGIYQFWTGNTLNFVSYQGGHLFLGDVINPKTKVSLSAVAEQVKTKELVSQIKDSETINFGNKNAKRTISVFTDVDCFYCRKLHEEVDKLADSGIKVRYVAFPAYKRDMKKHTSVWCADDQQKAMTLAKTGQEVPEKVCETPIMKTFEIGSSLGFRGTPQIVYDDGTIVGGYKPAAEIIRDLGLSKKVG